MSTDALKSRLKQDAAESRPAFSPLLHERMMSGVRAEVAPIVVPVPRRAIWPYAIAASLAVVATIAFHVLVPTPTTPPQAVSVLLSPHEISDPVHQLLAEATAPARESFDESKYAYLDQDAKRLMFFIADQMPSPPTAPTEKPAPQ